MGRAMTDCYQTQAPLGNGLWSGAERDCVAGYLGCIKSALLLPQTDHGGLAWKTKPVPSLALLIDRVSIPSRLPQIGVLN